MTSPEALTVKIERLVDRDGRLVDYVGKEITTIGWVSRVQTFKKHAFVTLRDGAGGFSSIQVVLPGGIPVPVVESYVSITGVVKKLPEKAYSTQPIEIHATSLKILSSSDPDFSSRCPSDAGPTVRLDERHLYLRDDRFALLTKVRAVFIKSIRKYFEDSDCTEIVPPSFVGNACEGGATLFHLKHPASEKGDVDCYLTQSAQFYLEMAVPALGDCFCIAPSFRREKSHTRRHLTEFLHAEAEWSGIFTFEDHLTKLKQLLMGILARFMTYCEKQGDLLKQLGLKERVDKLYLMTKEIVMLPHREAIRYCRDHEIYKDPETKTHFDDHDDIPEAQERQMIDQIGKIVFLCKFPTEQKSFYCLPDPVDPSVSWACDVEVPGVGEIIGSSVRIGDTEMLLKRMKEQGLKPEDYREYLDLRKYGHGYTSGMGLGVDRMLTWILDLHTIREIVTFPRYPGRLTP